MWFWFNAEVSGICYFLDGFKIDKFLFTNNGIIAEFKTTITVISFNPMTP
jgi:hypothetical protein